MVRHYQTPGGGFLRLRIDARWVFVNFATGPSPSSLHGLCFTRVGTLFTHPRTRMCSELESAGWVLEGGIRAGARLRDLTQRMNTVILPGHTCTLKLELRMLPRDVAGPFHTGAANPHFVGLFSWNALCFLRDELITFFGESKQMKCTRYGEKGTESEGSLIFKHSLHIWLSGKDKSVFFVWLNIK